MTKLVSIEGIGPSYAEKLAEAGVASIEALLERCGGEGGRQRVAATTGIDERLILRWVNHADLFRITGIGEEYADLLEAAGVDTVPELAQRRADNLHEALVATNEQKRLVRQVPALSQVRAWIEEARRLPRKVTY